MARVNKSRAATFNHRTLNKMRKALDDDPEVDLSELLPMRYSGRLNEMRDGIGPSYNQPPKIKPCEEDIRASLSATDPLEIIFPLSENVIQLLQSSTGLLDSSSYSLSQGLLDVMNTCEILWKAPSANQKMVFKCDSRILVKAVRGMKDYTEYTALQYLQRHRPNIPAPRPLGLLRMNNISLIFMTYLPSKTLSEIWPTLDSTQKLSIQEQLNTIMVDLRSLPFNPGTLLGGVGGEGCKDIRRHLRQTDSPIESLGDFEDFLFTGPHPGGHVFVELLRQMSPSAQSPAIVFTHGDLRPDNITVAMAGDKKWNVTGLLDWEYSGFYPEYYEAVRCTNCISPYEEDDWFLFLPDCISPARYAQWWLFDRVREARVC